MTEQQEDELICEKLLGWERIVSAGQVWSGNWLAPLESWKRGGTPTFRDWASIGLIIDAFRRLGQNPDLGHWHGKWHCLIDLNCRPQDAETPEEFETVHEAVRAAALHYLKQVPTA